MSILRETYSYIRGTAGELISSFSNALSVSVNDGAGNPIGSTSDALDVNINNDVNIRIFDSDGNPISSSRGAIDTHDAHVHHEIINKEFNRHTATTTTLAVATVGDGTEYQIEVVDASSFSAGDNIHVGNGEHEITHPKIISIATNVITLDRRLDLAHSIGTSIIKAVLDIRSLAGTLVSPVEYWVAPPEGEVWHLMRILFSMSHGTAGDLGKFGGIAALTNGLFMRAKTSGSFGTVTNWKTNENIKTDMFDLAFDTRSGGGGAYGTSCRGTFFKTGAIVRLDGDEGDRLSIFIQDDLTGLDSFTMKAQGHIEGQ